jgi:alpha-ketoglutarate-dependent taurine dioxygenase
VEIEAALAGGTTMSIVHVDSEPAPDLVDKLVDATGAVLIRDLGLSDEDEFHQVVTRLGNRPLDSYRGGNTPRTKLTEGVFTSTEYPARFEISLHNEMSYTNQWPSRLYFCCLVAASSGGATPLCDGNALFTDLPPEVRDRFETLGVTYHQHLHGGAGLGKSWQQTFETGDRAEVEQFLRDAEAEFEWTVDGGLRVRQTRPGVRRHPTADIPVWFNQADQWHPTGLPPDEAEVLLALVRDPADLPHWATYGDGSLISGSDFRAVRDAVQRNKLAVAWRPGDLMVVDNMRVLHGRDAFTGTRRVVVAMS